ncbi:hypothetical protein PTTG_26445 [Puccinia triticina 1-1 BBBD Race 1]|uniref:Uncharacterized protein n=2 Tax=Puccinia triticina TaxID=208348 RepID=A0A180GT95_PUCT1|nr:uncharacterized protein PtA15_5A329 [Puccinia triticina]OAV96027.1 hypothetical protein PTTG_26445 [Puccinia triticina 1-1 BBBD Race 1]WAQ84756.1 hypothetical protein PtA15_5A329 [Puccinia triticina]
MLLSAPKTTCLLFPNESEFITVLEVGVQRELSPSVNCKSARKQPKPPKISQKPKGRLGSKAGLLATPLEPSILSTIIVKSIIQRNHFRHAKVELGLYLLFDSDTGRNPPATLTGPESGSSPQDYWLDSSETSISFNDSLPSHLFNPPRLPIIQLVKNWWRYR